MENIAYPQLMFVDGEKYENQVFIDVVSETRTSFRRRIPEFMVGTTVSKATNHPDWLILVYSSIQLRLWNPVTLQSIDLPGLLELKSAECISHVFLTNTPDHPNSLILLWMKDPRAILFCCINGDDDQTWTHNLTKNYVEELNEVGSDEFFEHPVACDDDAIFMFSSCSRFMVKIETVKPLIISPVKYDISYPYKLAGPSRFRERRLLACCADLYMIDLIFSRVRNEIDGVVVLKLDLSDMSWNIIDSCPNAAFFISGDQAVSCPISSAESSQVGNRVYFTGFFDDAHTQFLYSYHIQQKKFKVSLLASPDNASQPYWIRVSDAGALEKAEEEYRNGGDSNADLFKRGDDELLISNINYYDDGNDETMLSDLPTEILRIISSHLINPVDYLSFRSASKFCLSIGSAKDWRNILGHCEKEINTPWLAAPFLLHKGVYSMVDHISRNKYYTVIPETLDKYSSMSYSSDGRILMSSHEFDEDRREYTLKMLLYNPLTKYIVRLPKSPVMLEHLLAKAGSVVVGVTLEHFRDFYSIATEESNKESEWNGRHLREEGEESKSIVEQSNVNVVCVGDFYYFLVKDGNLVYFSEEEKCLKTHGLKWPCARGSFERVFLVECDGDLLSIYVGSEWKWVSVFKFNKSKLFWEEVKHLKNNNIYVSTLTSIVTKPKSSDIGNKIYFPRFYKDSVVCYSLNTNKFHICDGWNSVMDNYYGSEEQLYSCWFQPTFN